MKSFVIVVFALFSISAYSQKYATAYKQLRDGNTKEAKVLIDEASADMEENKKVETWLIKGEIYFTLFNGDKTQSGGGEILSTAFESFMRAYDLDKEKKHLNDIMARVKQLSVMFFNHGVREYNESKFESALFSFEKSIEVNGLDIVQKVDTSLYFNAGMAADKCGNFQKSVRYFKKLIELQYNGSEAYHLLANTYLHAKDYDMFVETAVKGIQYYPNDNNKIISSLINYFLQIEDNVNAKKYVLMAIEKNPGNENYHFVLGNLYERTGDLEGAISEYKKASQLKTDYFEPLFNLGIIHYNKAAKQSKKMEDIKVKEQLIEENKIMLDLLNQSMVYFENALKLKPSDQETIKSLYDLYGLLEMPEKAEAIKSKMQ